MDNSRAMVFIPLPWACIRSICFTWLIRFGFPAIAYLLVVTHQKKPKSNEIIAVQGVNMLRNHDANSFQKGSTCSGIQVNPDDCFIFKGVSIRRNGSALNGLR